MKLIRIFGHLCLLVKIAAKVQPLKRINKETVTLISIELQAFPSK